MWDVYTFLIIMEPKTSITTESNKTFSGQQPRHLVERRVNGVSTTMPVHVIRKTDFSYCVEKNIKFYWIFDYCQPQCHLQTVLSIKRPFPTYGKLFGTKKLTLGF